MIRSAPVSETGGPGLPAIASTDSPSRKISFERRRQQNQARQPISVIQQRANTCELNFVSDILNKTIVLVLNRNWQAINVRTPQDAFCQMATTSRPRSTSRAMNTFVL
jgi:hypothetical protein